MISPLFIAPFFVFVVLQSSGSTIGLLAWLLFRPQRDVYHRAIAALLFWWYAISDLMAAGLIIFLVTPIFSTEILLPFPESPVRSAVVLGLILLYIILPLYAACGIRKNAQAGKVKKHALYICAVLPLVALALIIVSFLEPLLFFFGS